MGVDCSTCSEEKQKECASSGHPEMVAKILELCPDLAKCPILLKDEDIQINEAVLGIFRSLAELETKAEESLKEVTQRIEKLTPAEQAKARALLMASGAPGSAIYMTKLILPHGIREKLKLADKEAQSSALVLGFPIYDPETPMSTSLTGVLGADLTIMMAVIKAMLQRGQLNGLTAVLKLNTFTAAEMLHQNTAMRVALHGMQEGAREAQRVMEEAHSGGNDGEPPVGQA